MTALPLPYIVALMLLLLIATHYSVMRETASGRVFTLVLCLYAVSMVLIGLRWSRDLVQLLPWVASLALASSALLYLAFRSLGQHGPVVDLRRDSWHTIPALVVLIGGLFFTLHWLDVLVAITKLVYVFLLLNLARRAPESLQLVRLSWLSDSAMALWGATAMLFLSIVLDIIIAIDFAHFGGVHSAGLVGAVNMVNLLLLGWLIVKAGQSRVEESATEDDAPSVVNTPASQTDPGVSAHRATIDRNSTEVVKTEIETMRLLNSLLVEQKLYADTELNLQRLARKAGVPTRAVSRTINAQTDQNISQWINTARINAACELLRDPDVSVGDAMLQSGFLTKSNFNREFQRQKGCSPTQWRQNNQR